jgi:DnaJ-class molecular chaperone
MRAPKGRHIIERESDLVLEHKRDFYEILGVARIATTQEIAKAFLKLADDYHAAKPANIEAVERFRGIAHAYRILSDPEQRRRYDRMGDNAFVGQPGPATGYDLLDELERRAQYGGGGYYQWPYCDPALATFLNKLMGWE